MQEVPIDMNLQKHWRDHNIVTDDMVRWFKKNCGCKPYHGIKDLDNTSHYGIFSKNIPDGKVAWMKVDRRNGAMNIYVDNVVYTDYNGRNPSDYNMNPINPSN
jgi:hypothetical protein